MTRPAPPVGEDDLQAYVDGRLPEDRRAAVEAYLDDHAEARERIATERRHVALLRATLQGKLAEPIPARLRIASLRGRRSALRRRRWGVAAAALTIFIAGAGTGWLAGGGLAPRWTDASGAGTVGVANGATVAYRTFVGEALHPVEVAATQEAHLLQWLSKRLGRPLMAPDLSRFGYRLMGGRLLPAGDSAAAQLMYEDAAGRRLTIYVRAASGSETAFRFRQDGDAATFAWIDQGFGFAVTAKTSRAALSPIAEAVYHQLAGT
jgi:anti-sigma factor RsiW